MEISWNITTIALLGLGVLCAVETIALAFIAQVKDTVIELLKACWNKDYSMGLILTSNGKLAFKHATVDPTNTERWIFDKGGVEDGKRLQKGHSIIGSDRMDYAMFTEEGMESISIRDRADSELAGTSGYLQKTIDLAYDAGYNDGFDASHNKSNILPWVSQNWHILVIFLIIGAIAFTLAYDKMYTGPAGWEAANACEKEKGGIIGRCSAYIDLSKPLGNFTQSTMPPSATGGAVQ